MIAKRANTISQQAMGLLIDCYETVIVFAALLIHLNRYFFGETALVIQIDDDPMGPGVARF